jgi:hypothetical protein
MISELNTIFSGAVGADGQRSAQAITATALSTNVVDLRNASAPALSDTAQSSMVYLVVCALQAFNTLTSLTITLETDSTSNLATSPTTHLTFNAPLAALTAGAVIACSPLPAGINFERFMAVRYTVVGSNPTTGSVIAFLTDTPPAWQVYPSSFKLDV